jgi:hypothetical protein
MAGNPTGGDTARSRALPHPALPIFGHGAGRQGVLATKVVGIGGDRGAF